MPKKPTTVAGGIPLLPERNPRHWNTYATVSDWYRDFHGRVPVDTAPALKRLMERTGCTFPEANKALLDAQVIIVIKEELGGAPRPPSVPSATAFDEEAAGES